MKIIVCGLSGHGKDEFCQMLGLPYMSSSEYMSGFVMHQIDEPYITAHECHEDRRNHRKEWLDIINSYLCHDFSFIARGIFGDHDVYCGIRNIKELNRIKQLGLVDLVIWLDASYRMREYSCLTEDCSIQPHDCDIIIDNNYSKDSLRSKASAFRDILEYDEQPCIETLIADWANDVFPHRTITNAISKLVLEEIPEYLLAQDDPMELADVAILLYDIAYLAGIDLKKAIIDKMEINKKRKWQINPTTGLMKHIKE